MKTDFSKIEYNDALHSYSINGKKLESVTTIIKQIIPQFDQNKAYEIAAREGVTVEQIREDWDKKGEEGREKGTRIHSFMEDLLLNKIDPVKRLNTLLPEMKAGEAAWKLMQAKLRAKCVQMEAIVGDEELGVAGRIDIIVSINDVEKCIFDWKTGKFETKGNFGYLLKPFDDLKDCELNRYSLQISLYRLIVERNTDEILGNGYIIHLHRNGKYMIHRTLDLRERILKWLKGGAVLDKMFETRKNQSWRERSLEMLRPIDMATKQCSLCLLGRKACYEQNTLFDPHVFSNKNPSKFVVVGQNPGFNECIRGEPFVGEAGKFFDETIIANGLSRDDFYITNIVKCHSLANEKPKWEHINSCQHILRAELAILKPYMVITLGAVALSIFCPDVVLSDNNIMSKLIKSEIFNVFVFPIYHPSPRNMSSKDRKQKFISSINLLCKIVKVKKNI